MRAFLLSAFLPAVLLAGCASDNRPTTSATELERLRADCEARGGMLRPSGRISANPAIDKPCIIRGAATLPPGR